MRFAAFSSGLHFRLAKPPKPFRTFNHANILAQISAALQASLGNTSPPTPYIGAVNRLPSGKAAREPYSERSLAVGWSGSTASYAACCLKRPLILFFDPLRIVRHCHGYFGTLLLIAHARTAKRISPSGPVGRRLRSFSRSRACRSGASDVQYLGADPVPPIKGAQ
jgi:hypothetical protein